MEEYILSIKAIAANMNMTIGELADCAGIERNHLYEVTAGRVKMTADDLLRISKASNVPPTNIRAVSG